MFDGPITVPEEVLPSVVYLSAVMKPGLWGGLCPLGAVAPWTAETRGVLFWSVTGPAGVALLLCQACTCTCAGLYICSFSESLLDVTVDSIVLGRYMQTENG